MQHETSEQLPSVPSTKKVKVLRRVKKDGTVEFKRVLVDGTVELKSVKKDGTVEIRILDQDSPAEPKKKCNPKEKKKTKESKDKKVKKTKEKKARRHSAISSMRPEGVHFRPFPLCSLPEENSTSLSHSVPYLIEVPESSESTTLSSDMQGTEYEKEAGKSKQRRSGRRTSTVGRLETTHQVGSMRSLDTVSTKSLSMGEEEDDGSIAGESVEASSVPDSSATDYESVADSVASGWNSVPLSELRSIAERARAKKLRRLTSVRRSSIGGSAESYRPREKSMLQDGTASSKQLPVN